MLDFIINNLATIIICAVIALILITIIVHLIKNKKEGKSSCGCGCSGCPMSGTCHQKEDTKK